MLYKPDSYGYPITRLELTTNIAEVQYMPIKIYKHDKNVDKSGHKLMHHNTFNTYPKSLARVKYPYAAQLWLLLRNYREDRVNDGVPPQTQLAKELGWCENTMKKAVRELKEKGMLWIDRVGPGEFVYYLRNDDMKTALEFAASVGNETAAKKLTEMKTSRGI